MPSIHEPRSDAGVTVSATRADPIRPPGGTDILLEVRDLRTYFHVLDGTVKAVDGVSFTIRRGQTVGLVGESGCGKSVTALSIMRLLDIPPAEIASGAILFEGRDLLALSEEEMRHIRGNEIAMIFQEPQPRLHRRRADCRGGHASPAMFEEGGLGQSDRVA